MTSAGNALLLFRYVFVHVLMRMCMPLLLFMCLSMLMHVLGQLPVSMPRPSCATDADNICAFFLLLGSPHPEAVTSGEIPRVFVFGSPLRSSPAPMKQWPE